MCVRCHDLRTECQEAIEIIDATGVMTEVPSWLTDVATLTVEGAA